MHARALANRIFSLARMVFRLIWNQKCLSDSVRKQRSS
jgi:hypothetical protein